MELLLLLIISVSYLLVGVVGSHAAPLPSEIYRKNKFKNTPMPTILHDLLHPADQDGKPLTDVRTRSGDAYTPTQGNTLSAQPNWQRYTYSKKPLTQQLNLGKYNKHPPSQQFKFSKYSKNPPLGKNTIPSDSAATNRQLLDSPGASLFFLEKDFYPGAKMNLQFIPTSTASGTTFLPQKLAKVTPFSSNKLPDILNQFAINAKSEDAKVINQTIVDCEEPALENEEKYCATSLESLVEYGFSKIGKNVNVLTTVIVSDKGQRRRMRKQQYVVSSCLCVCLHEKVINGHKHYFGTSELPKILKKSAFATVKHQHIHKKPASRQSTIPNDNAATNRQLLDSFGASLFFLEKDLYPGAKMNLHFVVTIASGRAGPEEEAEIINEIIMDCEEPAVENEEKYCATSLESLVEYGTSKFGKNVNVLTTEISSDKAQRTRSRKQQYVVSSGVRQIVSDNLVACHSLPYPYAVFVSYVVPLVGADGTKIKATAVCHKDTSKWDPDHVAFQVLKVKPGTINPICHFLTEDNILWMARTKKIEGLYLRFVLFLKVVM
ncbi:hypothetical protein MKW92_009234 [Papaver armeniacum]|nr:hypothetical protein MKW92_009234 [Papaver armeniacum]